MSNQIFSNDKTKYYDYPGLNVYTSVQEDIPINTTIIPNFSVASSTQNMADTIFFQPGRKIFVTRPGMYTFTFILRVSDSVDPQNNDLEFNFFISLDRVPEFTGLVLSQSLTRYVSRVGGPGIASGIRIVPLTVTYYLKPGDLIYPSVTNYIPTALRILNTSTLTINKIY